MQLVFVDETGDEKFKDYLGVSMVVVDSAFYGAIKQRAQELLRDGGWDEAVEFKGSYLFSGASGCKNVLVEKRIELASGLIDLHVSARNRRMKFFYVHTKTTAPRDAYLESASGLLRRALPKKSRKTGKNLLMLTCDERSDISPAAVHEAVAPVLAEKGYVLHETVSMPRSNFHTVGLLYADIVGYLAARIHNISADIELFESIPPELLKTNGKVRKLVSSQELMAKVKKLKWYEMSGN
jgi:hypothetical protein